MICSVCGRTISPVNERYFQTRRSRKVMCGRCWSEGDYATCNDCGEFVKRAEAVSYYGTRYCESCAERRSNRTYDDGHDTIHGHDHKPTPIFYPQPNPDALFMGVELEIDGGGEDNHQARQILNVANDDREYIYIKTDGSLHDGLEIVTHPATLEAHMQDIPWRAILRKCRQLRYRSHKTTTCGLHVHLSRRAFGANRSAQDDGIMKLIFLVERYWTELVRFTRRTEGQLSEWARRYGMAPQEQPAQLITKAKDCQSRYQAVNIMPFNTVELRLFKGTLKLSTIIATLQLCQLLYNTAMSLSVAELHTLTWEAFCQRGADFPELQNYLVVRELISAPAEVAGDSNA